MEKDNFEEILEMALAEDLGERGDITSRAIFDDDLTAAALKSKDEGILAGIDFFRRVFERVDSRVKVTPLKQDGDWITPGENIALVKGPTFSVLEAERTAINFLSFLSGIASYTKAHVEAVGEDNKCVILDTRKTLPGYRHMSKYAVLQGGGQNHRMGLYDMVMIKDNHIDAAGSISHAVNHVRDKWGSKFRIEVECRDLQEVEEALAESVDVIMLDNMTPEEVVAAVQHGKSKVLFEASGNMDIEKIKEYAPLGIDFISVGALTHSVKAFDFSLVVS
ncbi:MAG: carboxylating nicotinate-nucleotide diphosphorylase [Spirochaetaceae bacterium]|jgi:nicotinate-nucleotide pyrophosphorylase (carboxylating)|nr:carboxylating nicotinate-nucleotide diphosphorylase [Spirochaetaceae bacterium]